jgi:uncharacterized Zn-binding protein involved in type VI secretion
MPAVCRIGHADIPHCSGMVRQGGSSNVFVNGIGISRETDVNTLHKKPPAPCPKHAKGITTGSNTVKINGLGCGRVGDPITGCTFVAEGSDDVFAG